MPPANPKTKPLKATPLAFRDIANKLGELVTEKNAAYGDSFGKAGTILEVLYPNGIEPYQYRDMLAVVRVIDKLFRIANTKDAFDEDPWMDIAGYGILSCKKRK